MACLRQSDDFSLALLGRERRGDGGTPQRKRTNVIRSRNSGPGLALLVTARSPAAE